MVFDVEFYRICDSEGKLVRSRGIYFALSTADYDHYAEWVQNRFEIQHDVIIKMLLR